MASHKNAQIIRWAVIITSFIIVALILWNTYDFFQKFKSEERAKMEFWSSALTAVANANENSDLDLPFEIISLTLPK